MKFKRLPTPARVPSIGLFVAVIALIGPTHHAMSEPSPSPSNPKPTSENVGTKTNESDAELRKRLTLLQYAVTKENATERPFVNEYWKHDGEGIYVDIISGKPLFSSKDKFETDCGWPGFAKPIDAREVKELSDKTHGMERIEVRSKSGDAHLGHVFNDGPKELGGLRYCINSAAIRFVPRENLAEAGYGEWLKLFPAKQGGAAEPAKKQLFPR